MISTAEKPHSTENEALRQALAREQKKLDRVKEVYENGVDTLAEYRQNKAKIQTRIQELQSQIQPEQPEAEQTAVRGRIKAGVDMLTRADISETTKNEILRRIIERITFIRPSGRVEICYRGDF
jgi:chromosome segregation ATPase